ncbi:fumarylacetoacetase-like [Daktulosphaira vitifoliae]|uniref:fumarylacetoacetase-like n=1 Tax=Daktulosphaira vitifoliae TaxID=58002 RepID=UPI0021AA0160|nr:fumarylacetoacetase-like [Daktulosphaira vitifoliae]
MPLKSYVPYTQESHFPIENLPYGVFSTQDDPTHRIGVAIGNKILDLKNTTNVFNHPLYELFQQSSLHSLMASSKSTWTQARKSIQSYLSIEKADNFNKGVFWNQNEVNMHLPVSISNYTDFFSCYHHAYNCGTIMTPQKPLADNWKHMPIGYNGRSSSVIISGTPITRPKGQYLKNGKLHFGPTEMLDYELEMAFFVGGTLNSLSESIPTSRASDYIFGMVMLNDWSARDIQLRESIPLGPFLSKSFATSISPWVVTMEALEDFKVDNLKQEPMPMKYLQHDNKYNFNINLNASVCLNGSMHRICDTNYNNLYWTPLQQIAHHTINGCNLQPGDLLSSGTISGPNDKECGCLFERTRGGQRVINLENDELLFFNDGDEVILSGYCQGDGYRIGFGTCSGKILPAKL